MPTEKLFTIGSRFRLQNCRRDKDATYQERPGDKNSPSKSASAYLVFDNEQGRTRGKFWTLKEARDFVRGELNKG